MLFKGDKRVFSHRSEGGGEGLALTLVEDRYIGVAHTRKQDFVEMSTCSGRDTLQRPTG